MTKPPRKGQTCLVSGAAGATGSVAAQLAKLTGATTIGIAGGEKKTKYLTDTLGETRAAPPTQPTILPFHHPTTSNHPTIQPSHHPSCVGLPAQHTALATAMHAALSS